MSSHDVLLDNMCRSTTYSTTWSFTPWSDSRVHSVPYSSCFPYRLRSVAPQDAVGWRALANSVGFIREFHDQWILGSFLNSCHDFRTPDSEEVIKHMEAQGDMRPHPKCHLQWSRLRLMATGYQLQWFDCMWLQYFSVLLVIQQALRESHQRLRENKIRRLLISPKRVSQFSNVFTLSFSTHVFTLFFSTPHFSKTPCPNRQKRIKITSCFVPQPYTLGTCMPRSASRAQFCDGSRSPNK